MTDESAARPGPAPIQREKGWRRAAALFLLAFLMLNAVRPSVIVSIAYVLMAILLPVRSWSAYTLGALLVVLVLRGEREGLWWVERGWALLLGAWFIAFTLRWPRARLMSRALGAVGCAATVAVVLLAVRGGGWEMLDWQVGEQFRRGAVWLLEWVHLNSQAEPLAPAMVAVFYRVAEEQARLFPALVGLGSLAGLAVAWWIFVRVALDSDGALAPLREFRFSDHLVWVFIGGLALRLLETGEGLDRAGDNAMVFMGALYALRGAAVVRFFGVGQSLFGLFLLALALLFATPVVLTGALVIGLGDTWLDLRGRARDVMA